ncbi:MAG: hypothetical protein ABSG97_02695 [Sedimentisphaerales bacterium]|jgi:hypothetical protein
MGAHPYYYFVKYNPDINAALEELRQREFKAGRYNPVIRFLEFPIGPDSPAPGAQHASIRKALKDADADGTRSILDLDHISKNPEFGAVSPLSPNELVRLFQTEQPTREMIEQSDELWEILDRGWGIYIIAYKDGSPDEIYFAGYSCD